MFKISKIQSENQLERVRQLFQDYQAELGLDLCFQGFQEELDELPGNYAEPKGSILLALNDANEIVGVVALKPLKEKATCEMKRLYVDPNYRKFKIGFQLIEHVIDDAKSKGYDLMKLDTLEKLQAAIKLYHHFGFQETNPYNFNPDATVKYFEKRLI
ncbi:Acetyltransferase (GNAT) family protein [Spirosomataceae bacterium TFI 002]|nr:Acetyltransferase (GNAT) family protein [Spirosomataceae bacterium TFI 002]